MNQPPLTVCLCRNFGPSPALRRWVAARIWTEFASKMRKPACSLFWVKLAPCVLHRWTWEKLNLDLRKCELMFNRTSALSCVFIVPWLGGGKRMWCSVVLINVFSSSCASWSQKEWGQNPFFHLGLRVKSQRLKGQNIFSFIFWKSAAKTDVLRVIK